MLTIPILYLLTKLQQYCCNYYQYYHYYYHYSSGPLGRTVHCIDRAIQNKEWINKYLCYGITNNVSRLEMLFLDFTLLTVAFLRDRYLVRLSSLCIQLLLKTLCNRTVFKVWSTPMTLNYILSWSRLTELHKFLSLRIAFVKWRHGQLQINFFLMTPRLKSSTLPLASLDDSTQSHLSL